MKRKRILKEKFYQRITHQQRLNVIYDKYIHNSSIKKMATANNLNYNSVRNILNSYKLTGRTNKMGIRSKVPKSSKKYDEDLESQIVDKKQGQNAAVSQLNILKDEKNVDETVSLMSDEDPELGDESAPVLLSGPDIQFQAKSLDLGDSFSSLFLYIDHEDEEASRELDKQKTLKLFDNKRVLYPYNLAEKHPGDSGENKDQINMDIS